MFPKVKNVNTESLKKGSKLLDFSQIVLNNLCHSFHSRSKFHSRDSCSKTKCRVCEVFQTRSHVEFVFHVFRTLHEEMCGRTLA